MRRKSLAAAHGHGHSDAHEEPWLVSYADMMTLLFGFFVILYSFSTIDQGRLNALGEEFSSTFGSKPKLGQNSRKKATAAEAGQGAHSIDLTQAATGDAPFAKESWGLDQTIRIALTSDLTFKEGTAELVPAVRDNMMIVAKRIAATMLAEKVATIEVTGHTDSRAIKKTKTYKNNHELSAARALAVAGVLMQSGVGADKIRVVGAAAMAPLVPEYDASGANVKNMAMNRRVEIAVVREVVP